MLSERYLEFRDSLQEKESWENLGLTLAILDQMVKKEFNVTEQKDFTLFCIKLLQKEREDNNGKGTN